MNTSTPRSKRRGGTPPEHSRFQKGKSGNPNGRPKGAKGLKTVMEQQLGKVVTVQENGRSVKRTMLELAVQRVAHDAVKGKPRAVELLLRYAEGLAADAERQDAASHDIETEGGLTDQDALRRLMQRLPGILEETAP